jgi:glucose-6-phosphate 1-epimerase
MAGKAANEHTVKLDFGLSSAAPGLDPTAAAAWPFKFNLIYSVTLDPKSLTTSIVATNDGDAPFDCQVLMHTYLRVKVHHSLANPPHSSLFLSLSNIWQ